MPAGALSRRRTAMEGAAMESIQYETILSAIPGAGGAAPDLSGSGFQDDLACIISSLSRLFFSTYYINLEQDTFRPVTQLRRVGDVLGNEVDCTAALQIYANHFVHPDDREEYLRVMNVDNLKRELRWWKPCVAVEYRRPVDDPSAGTGGWGWVRATAALARAGEDDAPLTAVYVAQDISGGRRELVCDRKP